MLYSGNLRRLARIYGTDKWGAHWYCQHYETHLSRLRKKKIVLLEIGIDGLNHKEYVRPGFKPSYFDQWIVSMHFYHGLVVIQKGMNDENAGLNRPGLV
ncbi:MAG TPA: hypothetical protein VNI01_04050 [Elusimicrobiota bacterium]|jgi:hypothetical protein|nr:hypothetical protein [Elusimicrobiota bacterium]